MIQHESGQLEPDWSQYEIGAHLTELRQRDRDARRVGLALGWLFWLLPGVGLVALFAYLFLVMSGSGTAVVTSGHADSLPAYIWALTVWFLGQTARMSLDNWPMVMMAAALFILMWMIRHL